MKFYVKPEFQPDPAAVFEGYGAVFGTEDLDGDIVVRGAFAKSLKGKELGVIKLLYQHDTHAPVGRWLDLYEDDVGLRVRGELLLDIERGRDCRAMIEAGILDGLSIGFRTVKAADRGRRTGRYLYELDLWEISLVTFPMHPLARIGFTENSGSQTARLVRTIERATDRLAGI